MDEAKIKCVTVSKCGNFLFLGYDNGSINKASLQSGKFRQW